jgi:hypothetical protein
MKIYPGEGASAQVPHGRLDERPVWRVSMRGRTASTVDPADQPVPEIRKQLLVAQRLLGRQQSVLGGFEGFGSLLEAGPTAEEALGYIRRVLYRGESVLEPFRDQLLGILSSGDRSTLRRLIEDKRAEIRESAVLMSRLETAQQNSRSLGSSAEALSEVLSGIRSEGDQLLNLDGKNALDLLS